MYYALNQDTESIEAYLLILSEIIRDKNQKYIDIFKDIISEAKSLGETNDFYSVSSERFGIISAIAKNHDLIKSIDIDQIKRDDYQKILDYLRSVATIES